MPQQVSYSSGGAQYTRGGRFHLTGIQHHDSGAATAGSRKRGQVMPGRPILRPPSHPLSSLSEQLACYLLARDPKTPRNLAPRGDEGPRTRMFDTLQGQAVSFRGKRPFKIPYLYFFLDSHGLVSVEEVVVTVEVLDGNLEIAKMKTDRRHRAYYRPGSTRQALGQRRLQLWRLVRWREQEPAVRRQAGGSVAGRPRGVSYRFSIGQGSVVGCSLHRIRIRMSATPALRPASRQACALPRAARPSATVYRPRRPEKTVVYQETWLAQAREADQDKGWVVVRLGNGSAAKIPRRGRRCGSEV